MGSTKSIETLRLSGDALCLDFVNTVDFRHAVMPHDYLDGYAALVAWALHTRAITEGDAVRLTEVASRAPRRAGRVLSRALNLREALYRIFAGEIDGRRPSAADMECLNRELGVAARHASLAYSKGEFSWEMQPPVRQLDGVLWPIARSASDLLAGGPLDKLGECPGDSGRCGWLFIDSTRNGTRRWCAMRGCGNREKARRHYARSAHRRGQSGGREILMRHEKMAEV